MTQASEAPGIQKWPFVLGDLVLVVTAVWIVNRSPDPFAPWVLISMVLCLVIGAWLSVTPFIMEHRSAVRFAESNTLTSTVEQLNKLETLASQIGQATSQWQTVQEQADKTAKTASEMGQQMSAEARSFAEFMAKANDTEKSHLRLEVEKLRRLEADWIQTAVRMLDHVYALYLAGSRSGQPNLREQLSSFQNACRDSLRRVGLMPFEGSPDEIFNPERHQVLDSKSKPEPDSVVAETLATGYTYQGKLLRAALVRVKRPAASEGDTPSLFGAENPA